MEGTLFPLSTLKNSCKNFDECVRVCSWCVGDCLRAPCGSVYNSGLWRVHGLGCADTRTEKDSHPTIVCRIGTTVTMTAVVVVRVDGYTHDRKSRTRQEGLLGGN